MMKSQKEIEKILHDEIDNFKSLNGVWTGAILDGANLTELQKMSAKIETSRIKILTLKDVLNHD